MEKQQTPAATGARGELSQSVSQGWCIMRHFNQDVKIFLKSWLLTAFLLGLLPLSLVDFAFRRLRWLREA